MAKSQDAKKTVKKEPLKTSKEKKAEKTSVSFFCIVLKYTGTVPTVCLSKNKLFYKNSKKALIRILIQTKYIGSTTLNKSLVIG